MTEIKALDLYYWPTPNGHKIILFLEETGVPYRINPVDIGQGDQFKPEFLKISPNNRMPAIVDHNPTGVTDPISVFESGAILVYLAEKHQRFLPNDLKSRFETIQWLFWQMAGLGPMAGQNHHFSTYAPEKIPYAIERYQNETSRLYRVLDTHLSQKSFVAGDEYTIADMAIYPWIVPWEKQGQNLNDRPHLKRWFAAIATRDATKRAYEIGEKVASSQKTIPAAAQRILFNQK